MQTYGDVIIGDYTPTLDDLKSVKLTDLQAQKAKALAVMQYTVGGQTYPVTLSDRDIIDVQAKLQALASAPTGSTTAWEIVDNVFLTWGLADVAALFNAGQTHINAVFANASTLAAAVAAAADQAALAAVDVASGWPTS